MKKAERDRERKKQPAHFQRHLTSVIVLFHRRYPCRANYKKALCSNRLRINTRIANSVIQCGASKIIHFRKLIQFRFAFHFSRFFFLCIVWYLYKDSDTIMPTPAQFMIAIHANGFQRLAKPALESNIRRPRIVANKVIKKVSRHFHPANFEL